MVALKRKIPVSIKCLMSTLLCLSLCFCHIKADEPDISLLIKQLKSPEESTRLKAAKELGKLGAKAKEAIPALTVTSEKDPDEDVRTISKKALDLIEEATGEAAKKEVSGLGQQLVKDLSHSNLETRIRAFRKIAEMGERGKQYNTLVVRYMVDSNPTIQRTAADTLEKINPQIYNQVVTVLHDNQNRSNALKELQRMGTAGKGALPALFAVYTTNDGRIYKSASEILETMVAIAPESQDVIALILNILSLDTNRVASRRSAAESHKHIAITLLHDTKADSKKATQALIVCLSDSQADIRTLAAKTLAKYGPDAKAALPTLQKMKLDSSKEVREAVAAAINAIN